MKKNIYRRRNVIKTTPIRRRRDSDNTILLLCSTRRFLVQVGGMRQCCSALGGQRHRRCPPLPPTPSPLSPPSNAPRTGGPLHLRPIRTQARRSIHRRRCAPVRRYLLPGAPPVYCNVGLGSVSFARSSRLRGRSFSIVMSF